MTFRDYRDEAVVAARMGCGRVTPVPEEPAPSAPEVPGPCPPTISNGGASGGGGGGGGGGESGAGAWLSDLRQTHPIVFWVGVLLVARAVLR